MTAELEDRSDPCDTLTGDDEVWDLIPKTGNTEVTVPLTRLRVRAEPQWKGYGEDGRRQDRQLLLRGVAAQQSRSLDRSVGSRESASIFRTEETELDDICGNDPIRPRANPGCHRRERRTPPETTG